MHYLSHYFTELPNDEPLFVAALGIPDLTRGFTRAYNSVVRHSPIPENKQHRLIHAGVHAHYEADKTFHNSPLFMQQTNAALQSLLGVGLDRSRLRLSVIAHIAVELMIDRQIILVNEKVCVDYYSCIRQSDVDVLRTYFEHLALKNEKKIFLTNFLFFREREFLFLFRKLENIVEGLSRIYSSVAGTGFTKDEKRRLFVALGNIDRDMRYSWQEILKR